VRRFNRYCSTMALFPLPTTKKPAVVVTPGLNGSFASLGRVSQAQRMRVQRMTSLVSKQLLASPRIYGTQPHDRHLRSSPSPHGCDTARFSFLLWFETQAGDQRFAVRMPHPSPGTSGPISSGEEFSASIACCRVERWESRLIRDHSRRT
jgi:hypothetical protein